MDFEFLQNPSNIMALYDDDELPAHDSDSDRESDVITLNTGPSIKEILETISPSYDPGLLRILVRRGHTLQDTLDRLRRCNVQDLMKQVQVTFIGETAEDEGGPRREMFSLCVQELSTSRYMCEKTLAHNGELRIKYMYRAIGWLMVLSLLEGGPAPRVFSPGVVRYLLQQSPQTGLEDMGMLQGNMRQLMDQSTLELQNNVDILFETRFEMGYTKPTLSMDTSDVADMLQVVSYHIAVESCRSELDQLAEGLQLFGFLEKARAHPGRMSCLLEVGQSHLTADSLYATIESRLSDVGTNARAQEEAVRVNFNSFLLDVEAKEVSTPITDLQGEESTYTLRLEDILFFITSCPELPQLGYPATRHPQMVFDHVRTRCLPTSNTCGCMLFIPMNTENITYDGLRKNLVLSVCGSPGFGQR